MGPIFNELSSNYRHVNFAKVDDQFANNIQVTLPTFKFFRSGQQIAQLVGAQQDELRRLVEQHAGSPESSEHGYRDLSEFITLNQVDCLNQHEVHNVRNVFKKDDGYLESDVDEQLLISIPFNQTVKLYSLKVVCKDIEHAPKTIKLFANRLNIGFDEIDSIKETQLIQLNEKDYEENTSVFPLKFVKFQSVVNITVFVQDNIGDEETTTIKELIFIGSPIETTKMENLNRKNEEG
ncbi:9305_t:CDS:2 [Acaulospora morrowiae]|uniref:9305_t:CDS:1 n=1 Tax=Acaulospora morrowiae TaxID=94023 RepID=A0A9N9IYB2_9GLOM|nr:9305_t:CDS:2 [Acaulospora morrowiae]